MIRSTLLPGLLGSLVLVALAGAVPATSPSPQPGAGAALGGAPPRSSPSLQPDSAGFTPQDRERAAGTIRAFHRALEEGDSATVVGFLAPDAFIVENGEVETREAYLAHHLRADMAFAAGVDRSSEFLHVSVSGDAAWVVSSSRSVGSVGDRPVDTQGAELVVLSRAGDEWRIRAIHWSSRR